MDPNQETKPEVNETADANTQPLDAPMYPEGTVSNSAQEEPDADHASKNLIIIAVLAVIVIVLALLYVWGSSKTMAPEVLPDPLPLEDPQTDALLQVQTGDEVQVIEEDLNTTELDQLDVELDQMMVELDAQLETQ